MVDENDRIIYANSKMAEILGHSKDDLVENISADSFHSNC